MIEINEKTEYESSGIEIVLSTTEADPTSLFIEEITIARLGGGADAN